jgi:hypothetical protein
MTVVAMTGAVSPLPRRSLAPRCPSAAGRFRFRYNVVAASSLTTKNGYMLLN